MEDGNEISFMESRLKMWRALEEAESPLKPDQVKNLQDQAILLNKRHNEYVAEIYSLEQSVELLGRVAHLIRATAWPMAQNFLPDGDDDEQLQLLRLRRCVEKVGAASQMMFDMTRLMTRVSPQK